MEETKNDAQDLLDSKRPPCATPTKDRSGKTSWYKPPVNCGFECYHCGWNHVVKKKRVDKMLAELAARGKSVRPAPAKAPAKEPKKRSAGKEVT